MPIARIDLIAGYDAQAKERLAKAVTDAIRGVVDAPPEVVIVTVNDIPPENYFRGGTARQPGPALPDAEGVVRAYLAAMEARDLDTAAGFLAPGFAMTFPGGVTLRTPSELVAWAAPRYRFVRKTYDGFDALGRVVWCFGTLSGEWPDGTPFEGIRFVDRFALEGGLLVRQDVWNDIAEVRTGGAA